MSILERLYCKTVLLGAAWTALLLIEGFIISNAQQSGTITGRVVNDEGSGVPNVKVHIIWSPTGQRMSSSRKEITTDGGGSFLATGLSPGLYTVSVSDTKEYVMKPLTAAERREQRYYRVGDNINITLVKGGVITGRVTNSDGKPMVGVAVSEILVRDTEGHPVRTSNRREPEMTDDRGIYRMFGLQPGSYIVGTVGKMEFNNFSPYKGSVTTYHPSSTHDTAAEVEVVSGGEVTGVDIRFRSERGRVVSGTVAPAPASQYTYVSLRNTAISSNELSGAVLLNSRFSIQGVADGDYEIIAYRFGNAGVEASSIPRRITVSGVDVTGIELTLMPLSSLSGKVLIEPSSTLCENKSKRVIEEIMIYPHGDDLSARTLSPYFFISSNVGVNEKGEFTIPSLLPKRYRFDASLPNENWYTKSITFPIPAEAQRRQTGISSIDISRAGLELKPGDKLTGVTVAVAEGAASLRGKVVAEKEDARLTSRLRVHLVPANPALTNEVLRYAEALINKDGTFVITNLAPGKYLLLLRPVPDDETDDRLARPTAWDSTERAKLRREAESKKIEVELKLCQRLSDFSIKF